MENKFIVTTSWDDGHPQNIRLAELLKKYGLKATFYLAKDYLSQPEDEIIQLSKMHEIGAHTLTHPILTAIDSKNKQAEIAGSKKWLEDVIKKPVEMFCYPRGFFDKEAMDTVRQAGFIGARTVGRFNCQYPGNFFSWDPTIQVYPFPFRKRDIKTLHWSLHLIDPLKQNFSGLVGWQLSPRSYLNWFNFAKATFDYAVKNGRIWHLWGHCFEIEKYNLWSDLEKIFEYISFKKETMYLTNGEVINYLKK